MIVLGIIFLVLGAFMKIGSEAAMNKASDDLFYALDHYSDLKNYKSVGDIGVIIMIVGGIFLLIGIILRATSNNRNNYNVYTNQYYGSQPMVRPPMQPVYGGFISRPVAGNQWECPACGSINPKYVGTCQCGMLREVALNPPKKVEEKPQPVQEKTYDENIQLVYKYKEMLDAGIITQEDFEAKKKELLKL